MAGRLVPPVAVVALLMAVGCGGDEQRKPEPSAKSKRFHAKAVEFHRRGQAVCRQYGRAATATVRIIRTGDFAGAMRIAVAGSERAPAGALKRRAIACLE